MSGPITIAAIQARVAATFGVSRADLVGPTRRHAIVRPRQVAMLLARELTPRSLPQIGRAFRRDHSTVKYSIQVIPKHLRRNLALRATVERLRADLGQPEGHH